MSDPIEQLNSLGDALEGAPMPLPASEIRARGERIRRRKHAIIAGASVAVVAAVAVPVVALTVGGSDDDQPFTPEPTISDPLPVPPSATLSERNLLTSKQAVYPNGGSDWRESGTFEGDGETSASPCQQSTFEGLGAGSVFQRDFEFVVTDTGEVEPTLSFNEVIAEFPSDREAEAAYLEIRGWYDDCTPPGSDSYDPGEFSDVPIGEVGLVGGAEVQVSRYGPVDEELDPFGDEGWYLETGLVRIENRIAVITQLTHGQDYNWPEGTPVFQMVPDAATQLAIGNEDQPVDPTPSEPAIDWPTVIPADFPLTSGWPEGVESSELFQLDPPSDDNQAMIPAGELNACLFDAVDPGAIARLTTRLSYGSDNYVRELQLFPTDQEAVTYLAQLRALYEGCPTDDQNGAPPTFTTEVGDGAVGEESVVITRASDGIGREVINVVRVGNAVVVDLASDEGTGDTVIDLATVTRENLADVIAAMNELQGGGAPDLTDPAGTTAIPADFPLDLAVGEPPVEDSEATIDGPAPDVEGVRAQTACGATLAMPGADGADPADELGYALSAIEGFDGRTLHTYGSVQDALDQMELLRSQIVGCDRDSEGDGLSDRLWRTFSSDTGYDSETFGYTYEVRDDVGATAGQLYTVVRVGNAILAVEWAGEYSAEFQADSASEQVALARLIAAEMCIFTEAGC